ncbi:EF-hand domain-containing protein, partial [Burkholderia thailandensis]|nr:EF-hand domain-containing protein [Burkholderia thailandensis]
MKKRFIVVAAALACGSLVLSLSAFAQASDAAP